MTIKQVKMCSMSGVMHTSHLRHPVLPHQVGKNYKNIILNIGKNAGEMILNAMFTYC